MSLNQNYKTSICKYAHIGCKQLNKCWYAHNKNELRIRPCFKDINCDDKNCCFQHSNKEINKDEYYLKILLKSDIIGLDKLNIQKYMNNKYIIEIDLSDDSNENCEEESKVSDTSNSNEIIILEEDKELFKYINDFTKEWNNDSSLFYDKLNKPEIKKSVNINFNLNETQYDLLLKYLNVMNIDYSLKK
jgi:hypothetical protein